MYIPIDMKAWAAVGLESLVRTGMLGSREYSRAMAGEESSDKVTTL